MTTSDLEALARQAGLERVGARPRLREYLAEVWNRRAFAATLARYRIEASLQESRLGIGWVVLQPLLNAAMYGTVFGLIMSSDSRPDNFIPFLVVGVFIFQFFSKSFSGGANSITRNRGLVRSLNFPRMLMPLAQILQHLFELIPMVLVMLVIVIAFGEPITWGWLMIVPILGLMTLFNLGIALITARLTVHLRDIQQVIPILSRLVFYSSGIFYSLELVLADEPAWILTVTQLNPVHDYIALVRHFLLEGQPASPLVWTVAVAAAVVSLVVGVIFFWRAEERYGRD